MGDRSEHFSWSEIRCKCGCGYAICITELLDKLEEARKVANIPFVINSWCRCNAHNKAVGGVANSSHLKGLAVDIKAETKAKRLIIYLALRRAGFKRIGIGEDYIHADVDDSKSDAIWRY